MTRGSLLTLLAVASLVAASTAAEARAGSGGGSGSGKSVSFSRLSPGNSARSSISVPTQHKPIVATGKHDESHHKWKHRPIYSPSVVVVSPLPAGAPVGPTNVTVARTAPARIEPVKPSSVASQAELTAPADAAATCLTKEYLETGAVMFRDVCTKEWAINSTDVAKKVAPAPQACLTKDSNTDSGVVTFRDTCTKEWAMNTRDQLAQNPQ